MFYDLLTLMINQRSQKRRSEFQNKGYAKNNIFKIFNKNHIPTWFFNYSDFPKTTL